MITQHSSILCSIPTTILELIALETALLDPLGPPADLIPLLQTCQYINHVLSFKRSRHLYALIFRNMFDYRAANRRFGPRACYSSNLAVQLKTYCRTLKHIRRADMDAESLDLDLWNAFFMMSENDGRNAIQLQWAGLKDFVDRLVRERLWHDRATSHNWPQESTKNALALWLMWFTTDQVPDHFMLLDSPSYGVRNGEIFVGFSRLASSFPPADFEFPPTEAEFPRPVYNYPDL
ncbi:hypothetical protein BXZ70DRAFT_947440 [Cristinia sonorae]|uniref:F-box domain-containing protein n=1 Tax=Cristinia sonorae TaxID=1940300 RepID=A0A8K0UKS2_9AGAR|nr:hypothetical protein BXZ70DRAFT_947440 [Cristinia sonorae]